MKRDSLNLQGLKSTMRGSLKSYLAGFILSIILTLTAFWLVISHSFSPWTLMLTVGGLACTQAVVQLFFFLHLNIDSKAPWNLIAFLFMLTLVLILVLGTLWIMYNLDYYMMAAK